MIDWHIPPSGAQPACPVPASDLSPGDIIRIGDSYPCDLVQVIHRTSSVVLYWGYGPDDGTIVDSTAMVDLVGWFDQAPYV